MLALLVTVFVLSGAAGLIYESIWSRYLGLFVGHSAYAQIIVLAIFLGGMSVGALLVGRRSERMREPLLGYAIVELIVGVIGLVFHEIFVAVTDFAYASLLAPLAGSGWLIVVKWSVAALLILPQSVLLGMTFPLMTAGAIRRITGRPGHTLALLYFANSLGAALGVLVAGFALIRIVGLPGTLLTAAALNMVVAGIVYVAARSGASTSGNLRIGNRGDGVGIRSGVIRRRAGTCRGIPDSRFPIPASPTSIPDSPFPMRGSGGFCSSSASAPRSRRSSTR